MVPYHDIRGWILKVDGWVVGGGEGLWRSSAARQIALGPPKKQEKRQRREAESLLAYGIKMFIKDGRKARQGSTERKSGNGRAGGRK